MVGLSCLASQGGVHTALLELAARCKAAGDADQPTFLFAWMALAKFTPALTKWPTRTVSRQLAGVAFAATARQLAAMVFAD